MMTMKLTRPAVSFCGALCLAFLAILLLPLAGSSEEIVRTSKTFAYVTNQGDGTVSVIDTSTNSPVEGSPIFLCSDCDNPGPTGLAVTPNGRFVYVANQFAGNVAVINTSTYAVTNIPLSCECTTAPFDVAITPNGSFVYVTDNANGAVYVIQTSDNEVVATITGVGENPQGIAIDPTGTFAYVGHGASESDSASEVCIIALLGTSANTVTGTIPVGFAPTGVAFQPGAHVAYVTNDDDGTISIINTSTNTVTNTITLPLNGEGPAAPYFVAFTPDGKSAYVTDQGEGGGRVIVINTASPSSTPTLISPTDSSSPVQIAITPDGSRAYVPVGSGNIVPISTSSNSAGTEIEVGSSPFGIAISPETAILTGGAQTIAFPFLNGSASISFTFPAGWCVNTPCTVAASAKDEPDSVWRAIDSANYPNTDIAPITELPGNGMAAGDGLLYTVTCTDGLGGVCTPNSSNDTYTTNMTWDTQVNICGMGPGLGKEETSTWENILGTCTFTADPAAGTSGSSRDGLSRWASFYHVTGTPSATVTINTPSNGAVYIQDLPVTANYSCGGTFFECAGTVMSGSAIDTSSLGLHTFTAEADVTSGPTAKSTVTYFVGSRNYGVQLLYPANSAVKSPATFPIKMYLTNPMTGADVSSSSLTVNATNVLFINGNASGDTVMNAGNSNPDNNFRFDSSLGPSGGYIFNYKTTGLPSGNYLLEFTVSGDAAGAVYAVPFAVR